jgi:tripartite-type tricarboxylate transporter receptor subunit TctC
MVSMIEMLLVSRILSWRRMLVSVALGLLASLASAQGTSFPQRTITIVVPSSPGGNIDIVARVLAERLEAHFHNPVIVENRTGASTAIGSAYVARSAPDGYTLLFTGQELVVNQFHNSQKFSYETSFLPISLSVEAPIYLVVRKDLPVHSVADLVALARARPGQLTYASSGIGTSPHLAGELFKAYTGTDITHIPYLGGAQSLNDVIAGRVDLQFPTKTLARQFVAAKSIRALASAGPARLSDEPGLPTVGETVAGYEIRFWTAMVAPPGTPAGVIDTLAAAMKSVLAEKAVVARFEQMGLSVINQGPREMAAFMQKDREKWGRLVQTGKLRLGD